jgi:hypothetical protein
MTAVEVGDRLPELAIPITRTLIVSGAIATRDFQDVHHDTPAAQARSLPDIITNIYTTEALVTRYVTDWAGPGTRLKKISLKLGVSNHPGDTMRLNGSIRSRQGRAVEVEVSGANSLGEHVRATVALDLPGGSDG